MVGFLATLLLTSAMTPAEAPVEPHARPTCFGIYATASVVAQKPYGSWYRGEIGHGGGLGVALGHRAHRFVALEAGWFGGISGAEHNVDDVLFDIANVNARVFTTPDRYKEWFVEAGVSPLARMRIGGLVNRGYGGHVGSGVQWGRRAVRGTAGVRYHFVRYTDGSYGGYSGTLGRQRHGDLLLLTVGLTAAP